MFINVNLKSSPWMEFLGSQSGLLATSGGGDIRGLGLIMQSIFREDNVSSLLNKVRGFWRASFSRDCTSDSCSKKQVAKLDDMQDFNLISPCNLEAAELRGLSVRNEKFKNRPRSEPAAQVEVLALIGAKFSTQGRPCLARTVEGVGKQNLSGARFLQGALEVAFNLLGKSAVSANRGTGESRKSSKLRAAISCLAAPLATSATEVNSTSKAQNL